MTQLGKDAAKQKFMKFLGRQNLRLTSQRKAIIQAVFNTSQHFTAEQLLEWSRQLDPSVSRATIYRTLPLLTQSGFVREMDLGKDYKIYDPNYADHPYHSHIICRDCNKILEFNSEKMVKLGDEIAAKLGFKIQSQRLEITANCEEFKRLGFCTKKDH